MKVLNEIWEKYDRAEELINDRIHEICSHEALSSEEVIYFLVNYFTVYLFLLAFLALK